MSQTKCFVRVCAVILISHGLVGIFSGPFSIKSGTEFVQTVPPRREQKNENSSLKLANSSQNVELPGNNVVPLVPSSLAPTLTRGSSFQVEPMNLTLAFCGKSVSATLIQVAQNMGYESIDQNFTQADLIWSYHCHWKKLKGIMSRMNIPQRINKIPGIHHVTMKALLGQSKWPFLLKSFYLPSQVQDLQAFRAQNPAARLLSKSPQHGQIRMFDGTVTQTRVVQELLEKPMLIDGHKFDVTMYVLVSSVDPLRVYIFGEDYKLRFSPVVYNNRSQNILGYIVQDHAMTEIEKRPSLATLIKAGYSHKAAFTIFLQRTGLDPGRIYQDMQDTVIQVLSFNAPLMREEIARDFPHLSPTSSFFHLTRWDFILDTIGRVYLLEVNGSPYMNSGTFEGFMRISRYFHDALSLLGLDARVRDSEREFIGSQDISTDASHCMECSQSNCAQPQCWTCLQCLSEESKAMIGSIVFEHRNRKSYRALIPSRRSIELTSNWTVWSQSDQILQGWIQKKCKGDSSWCD